MPLSNSARRSLRKHQTSRIPSFERLERRQMFAAWNFEAGNWADSNGNYAFTDSTPSNGSVGVVTAYGVYGPTFTPASDANKILLPNSRFAYVQTSVNNAIQEMKTPALDTSPGDVFQAWGLFKYETPIQGDFRIRVRSQLDNNQAIDLWYSGTGTPNVTAWESYNQQTIYWSGPSEIVLQARKGASSNTKRLTGAADQITWKTPSANFGFSGISATRSEGTPIQVSANAWDRSGTNNDMYYRFSLVSVKNGVETEREVSEGWGLNSTSLTPTDSGDYKILLNVLRGDGAWGTPISQSITVDSVAPTGTLGNNGPINQFGSVSVEFSNQNDPSSDDINAGLHYCFALSQAALSTDYNACGPLVWGGFQLNTGGDITVWGRIIDKDNAYSDSTTLVRVNGLPVPTPSNVTTNEDTGYTFALGDFHYNDLENNALTSISISSLNLASGDTLKLNGIDVSANQIIPVSQIGGLIYTPASNANGASRSGFFFRANDSGTGVATASVTINVASVNDLPVANASTAWTPEDVSRAFSIGDFTYTDIENNALTSITIASLSLALGDSLKFNGVSVSVGQTIPAAQLSNLVYTAASNASGGGRSTFGFKANDADFGTTSALMSVNVVAVNDPPVSNPSAVTTNEDSSYTFTASDFKYLDVENDALVSITIGNISLASSDTLKLGGSNVSVNQTIAAAQIPSLVFAPAANANGSGRSSFNFTVNDASLGTIAAAMTLNVNPINDRPTITSPASGSVLENQTFAIDVNGADVDVPTTLSYSILVGADSELFNIDSSTGIVTFKAAPDFEAPNDIGVNNVYDITVLVSDGSLSTSQSVIVSVTNVDEAPQLTIDLPSISGNVLATMTNSGTWSDPESQIVTLSASLGTIVKNSNGTWSWSFTPTAKLTNQVVAISASDGGQITSRTFLIDALVNIVDAKVYYKGSAFAQNGVNVAAALDTSKEITQSTSTARTLSYVNLINTTRGINGLVFDLAGLSSTTLSSADFGLRMSPTGLFDEAANPPSLWGAAPTPTSINVTPGSATTPARVRLEWTDNAIANRWLQLRVLANTNTGLTTTAVYYVGHLQGELDGKLIAGSYFVNNADLALVNPIGGGAVPVTQSRDVDKNRFVLNSDGVAIRDAVVAGLKLRNITVPIAGSVEEDVGNRNLNLFSSSMNQSDDRDASHSQYEAIVAPVTLNAVVGTQLSVRNPLQTSLQSSFILPTNPKPAKEADEFFAELILTKVALEPVSCSLTRDEHR